MSYMVSILLFFDASSVGCSPWGREESDTTERLHFHFSLSCIGEGNGKPLKVTIIHVYAPTTHLKKLKLNGFMMTYKTYSPWGRKESDMTERLHFHFSLSWIGEGNGNPLQCSCLENPRDGGAWWAAIYGVAQSRT